MPHQGKRVNSWEPVVEVLTEDTVPLALWCALMTLHDYEQALWKIFDALELPESDSDTLGAIVGGIVGLSAHNTVPTHWRKRSEPLDFGHTGKERLSSE